MSTLHLIFPSPSNLVGDDYTHFIQKISKGNKIRYCIPDYCVWKTRITNKILPHLLILENTKKVHNATK